MLMTDVRIGTIRRDIEGILLTSLDRRMKTMKKQKTIVVWGREDILISSIKLFLAVQEDWTVVSITSQEELDALVLNPDAKQPDIVVIHQGCHNSPEDFPLQLLQEHPTIKVIMVSLEDNLMDVYSKQKVLLRDASDLISAIGEGD